MIRFLRFLSTSAEALLQRDEVVAFDVVALRRELTNFQQRLAPGEGVSDTACAAIRALRLNVDADRLEGGRRDGWRILWQIATGRIEQSLYDRRRVELALDEIREFRNRLDHVLFSLEM